MKLKSTEIFSVSLLIARVNAYKCFLSQTGNVIRKRKINSDSGIKKWGSLQLMEESCQDQILCEAKFHPLVFEGIIPQRSWALVQVRLRTWLGNLTVMETALDKCCSCPELIVWSTRNLELNLVILVGPFQHGLFYDTVVEITLIRNQLMLNEKKNEARTLNNSCKR